MVRLFVKVKKKEAAKAEAKPKPGRFILQEILSGQRRNEVKGIAWWALSLFVLAACFPHAPGYNALGPAGEVFFRLSFALFGAMMYLLPLLLIAYGYFQFKGLEIERGSFKLLGLALALLSLGVLLDLIHPDFIRLAQVKSFYVGAHAAEFWASLPRSMQLWNTTDLPVSGLPSHALAAFLIAIISTLGTYIACAAVFVISLYFLEAESYALAVLKRLRERAATSQKNFGYAAPRTATPANGKNPATPVKPVVKANVAETERPKIKISAPIALPIPAPAVEKKSALSSPAAAEAESEFATGAKLESDEKVYALPGLDLLLDPKAPGGISESYFEGMSQTLENALAQFGVEAKVVEVCPGPVVTRYELQPSPGVKVNRFLALSDDIALALRAEHVRIEAPIPGKGAVGIEIPNQERQVVVLKEMVAQEEFRNSPSILTVTVGKDIGGKHIFAQLETMPHLLIAGATGSGKSACINSIISSLLYRATPREVRFLMIDPKRVELTMYGGIPHLKSPVITDSREAAAALRLMVLEMEERYKKFAEMGVRDIAAYNQGVAEIHAMVKKEDAPSEEVSAHKIFRMPYIVIFIDELADLMMVAANEVESAIARLAQMARGVGIHMVLATQRPSVDVITGIIKANFPSRIAFQVSSKVDSRTILDANGADALLGRGDMLYSPASATKPLRIQGVFITTKEVDNVVRFWKKQGAPVFDAAFSKEKLKAAGTPGQDAGGEDDELFQQAVEWVVRAKQASTSMLQRRLKVGYSRAARLLDLMEEKGIVGAQEGSKPRKVLIQTEENLDTYAQESAEDQ